MLGLRPFKSCDLTAAGIAGDEHVIQARLIDFLFPALVIKGAGGFLMAGFVAVNAGHAAASGFPGREFDAEGLENLLPFDADIGDRCFFRAMREEGCRGRTPCIPVVCGHGEAVFRDLARQPFMEQMHAVIRAIHTKALGIFLPIGQRHAGLDPDQRHAGFRQSAIDDIVLSGLIIKAFEEALHMQGLAIRAIGRHENAVAKLLQQVDMGGENIDVIVAGEAILQKHHGFGTIGI